MGIIVLKTTCIKETKKEEKKTCKTSIFKNIIYYIIYAISILCTVAIVSAIINGCSDMHKRSTYFDEIENNIVPQFKKQIATNLGNGVILSSVSFNKNEKTIYLTCILTGDSQYVKDSIRGMYSFKNQVEKDICIKSGLKNYLKYGLIIKYTYQSYYNSSDKVELEINALDCM